MTMKNKETLEKLRTYQIGVIRSVIASRQGRLGTYLADATDRERLADTDGLAYEEYYESPPYNQIRRSLSQCNLPRIL